MHSAGKFCAYFINVDSKVSAVAHLVIHGVIQEDFLVD